MRPDGGKANLARAFADAAAGIAAASRERNFRIELCFGASAVVLGILLRISLAEWLAVVVCIGLVLGGECANTAMEALVDLASPDYHPLAKRAKDAAAGAVLLFSAASLAVGVAVFLPRMVAALGLGG